MVKEVEIETVEDYLKIIKKNKRRNVNAGNTEDFLFRGQRGDHPLMPKIARLQPKEDLLTVEQVILKEFKRTTPLLIDGGRPLDDWDYLALGQHFGLPTRLLDWSYNALTALWFAIRNDDIDSRRYPYAVVWMMMAESSDFELDVENVHPFSIEETRIFRPRIIKQRINNQAGVFSIQPSREIEDKVKIDESDSFKEKLIKVKIPEDVHSDIRTDLNTMGVNAYTIFPELSGLCSHLEWQYFY